MRLFVAFLLVLVAAPVAALERPVPRPSLGTVEQVVAIRPVPRPGGAVSRVEVVDRIEAALIAQSALSVLSSTAGRDLGVEVASRAVVSDAAPRGQDPALVLPAPKVRPEGLVEVMSSRGAVSVPELPAVRLSMRPMPRVAEADRVARLVAAAIAAPDPIVGIDGALRQSARPEIRPAIRLAAGRRLREGRGGGLCGRASIQGETIAAVPGRGACGIPQAVRITQVSGVALSRGSRMDCGTAQALDDWVRTGVIPTVGGRGGGVTQLEVAAGYACRTRNSLPGARISEHGKGRAIDISGIKLANGEVISVLRDWGKGAKGRILSALWRAACGPFGTVLGPNSDRFHRDHFHFDTARYRSGSYCR